MRRWCTKCKQYRNTDYEFDDGNDEVCILCQDKEDE